MIIRPHRSTKLLLQTWHGLLDRSTSPTKRLHWSWCHFWCRLGWAQGNMYYVGPSSPQGQGGNVGGHFSMHSSQYGHCRMQVSLTVARDDSWVFAANTAYSVWICLWRDSKICMLSMHVGNSRHSITHTVTVLQISVWRTAISRSSMAVAMQSTLVLLPMNEGPLPWWNASNASKLFFTSSPVPWILLLHIHTCVFYQNNKLHLKWKVYTVCQKSPPLIFLITLSKIKSPILLILVC